jgi:hypothetical protein
MTKIPRSTVLYMLYIYGMYVGNGRYMQSLVILAGYDTLTLVVASQIGIKPI